MPRSSKPGLFKSWDGVELFYRRWEPLPSLNSPRQALIVLADDGADAAQALADGLELGEFWIFSFDARGQGCSPGPKGYARDFGELVRDLEYFARTISNSHRIPIEEMSILASRRTGVIAAAWLHDYAPRLRSITLVDPAFKPALPFPSWALRTTQALWGQYSIKLRGGVEIASQVLIGHLDTGKRILTNAGALITPSLLITTRLDGVTKKFFASLGSSEKKTELVITELTPRALGNMRSFIRAMHERQIERDFLRAADREGPSQLTYARLSRRVGIFSRIVHRGRALGLALLARLSETMRIGLENGFDSGLLADHEYRNLPAGTGVAGRFLDRLALKSERSQALRMRKACLERAIEAAVRSLHAAGEPARIVDLAGGPGRYLLEVANRHRDKSLSILIRDHVPANLAEGRRVASALQLLNVRFEEADAFLDPILPVVPNIVILSGLLELYPSNAIAARAIDAAARAIKNGGYVIYTGQPWQPRQTRHPRVTIDRDGKPNILRTRSQAELDELFRAFGFHKIWTEADPFGLHTVSLASRRADETSVFTEHEWEATAPALRGGKTERQ